MRRTEATEEELLNRLAAIQAAAEILDDHSGMSNPERQMFLKVIRTETERMQALVRHIARLFPDCMQLPASA